MNYLISEEVGNKLLNYIKKRPYEEVFEMVHDLLSLQQVPDDLLNNAEQLLSTISGQDVKVGGVEKIKKVKK